MPKPHRLNVKRHLISVEEMCRVLLDDHGKHPGGVVLPPAYYSYVAEISLFTRAILRRHNEKHTRKDIYIERRLPHE